MQKLLKQRGIMQERAGRLPELPLPRSWELMVEGRREKGKLKGSCCDGDGCLADSGRATAAKSRRHLKEPLHFVRCGSQ